MDKKYFLPLNFGGLQTEDSQFERSKVVILPVPYEGTSSYRVGAKKGPKTIIEASRNLELFDLELRQELYKIGIHTLPEVGPVNSPKGMTQRVCEIAREMLKSDKFIIMLGGEHSLTLGLVQTLKEKYQGLSVLQFDAHANLRNEYGGTKYGHACVMRRVSELCPFVQVGIRSMSQEEASFLQTNNIEPIYAKDFSLDCIEKVTSSLSQNVYITVDLDVLDPSIMPATGTPEPGGLLWPDFLSFLYQLADRKNIVGFDVVELCPLSNNVAPDFLAAKLVYKLIGYVFSEQLESNNNEE